MTDEDWVNKARDARNHHVRSGNDNCDKCYYEAVGHRSNIIKHFFSDEYIHSQFHKCPNENCEFGYCTLQSLITHAEVIHKGSLRKSESLENQNTGGIFYCIIPKAKEILSPVSLFSFFPTSIEKLTPKKIFNSGNFGNVTRTSQDKLSIKSSELSTSSSITHQTISTKSEGIDTCSNNIPKDQLRDYSRNHSKQDINSRSCKNSVHMPIYPFTTTAALAQNILPPVNLINMINSHLILGTSNLAGKIESIDINNGESNQRSKRQRSRNKGTCPKAPGQRSLKNGQRRSQRRTSTTSKELEEIKKQMKNLETLLKELDGIKDMILANALLCNQQAMEVSTQGTQTENTEETLPLEQILKPYHLDDECLRRCNSTTLEDHHKEFTLLDHREDEDKSKKMKYRGMKCHSAEENHDDDYIVLTTTTSGMSPFQRRRRMRRSFFYREGSQWGF